MSSYFTQNFGIHNAKNFESFVANSVGTIYLTLGQNLPWNAQDTVPAYLDNVSSFYSYWNNLIALKKITAADMHLVVPRIDWVSGTVYSEYTENLQTFAKASETAIAYTNKFYARNSRDQVFKCLFNNSGVASTSMPEINLGGFLPQNPYVQTNDGYKWKYLYTIPAGLKEKFFTADYMPIVDENIVLNNAVDGRLDIFKIVTAGTGYNANVASNSYNIITVTGDGSSANLTAKVNVGITDINIIDGGNNYTRATITISDPQKVVGTVAGNVIAYIGPPGGHGSDVAQELGASNLMVTVDIEGDESGVLPISTTESSEFRQIGILRNLKLSDGSISTTSVINPTTKYQLNPPNKNFALNETVYVGTSLSTATFTGVVVHYNSATFTLYLNNVDGNMTLPATITGATSGAIATAYAVENPVVKKYSGNLIYVNNTSKVTRILSETEQLKLTLRF
jgi:hypothetical protein